MSVTFFGGHRAYNVVLLYHITKKEHLAVTGRHLPIIHLTESQTGSREGSRRQAVDFRFNVNARVYHNPYTTVVDRASPRGQGGCRWGVRRRNRLLDAESSRFVVTRCRCCRNSRTFSANFGAERLASFVGRC